MFRQLLVGVLFVTVAWSSTNFKGPCKDWCGAFCLDSCQSTLATPVCMGDTECTCICPTTKADCNATWCNNYCSTKAQSRKFEAQCAENNQICKCQFEQKAVPGKLNSRLLPTNITYVADSTLLNAEFKCTQEFCTNYCTLRGEGRKFQAHCDETQSCQCQYERQPLPSLSTLVNATRREFKCTHAWCAQYCESKSRGRKFEARCNEQEACSCEYAWQPTGAGNLTNVPAPTSSKCTHEWCSQYCDSKSGGRKFEAHCSEENACKCEYAWQPSGRRTVVSSAHVMNG